MKQSFYTTGVSKRFLPKQTVHHGVIDPLVVKVGNGHSQLCSCLLEKHKNALGSCVCGCGILHTRRW